MSHGANLPLSLCARLCFSFPIAHESARRRRPGLTAWNPIQAPCRKANSVIIPSLDLNVPKSTASRQNFHETEQYIVKSALL